MLPRSWKESHAPEMFRRRSSSLSSLLLSRLELSDTKAYEPQIRALLGTASHFCRVIVLKLRTVPMLPRSWKESQAPEMLRRRSLARKSGFSAKQCTCPQGYLAHKKQPPPERVTPAAEGLQRETVHLPTTSNQK